jgi:hypothetical protein
MIIYEYISLGNNDLLVLTIVPGGGGGVLETTITLCPEVLYYAGHP